MATGSIYRKLGEIWACDFCDMRADKPTQTNRDTRITVVRTPHRARNNHCHHQFYETHRLFTKYLRREIRN